MRLVLGCAAFGMTSLTVTTVFCLWTLLTVGHCAVTLVRCVCTVLLTLCVRSPVLPVVTYLTEVRVVVYVVGSFVHALLRFLVRMVLTILV